MGELAEKVRTSCEKLIETAKHVKVNEEKVKDFAANVVLKELENGARPIPLPLRFPSWEDEVNFWTCLNLINFGSGYRHLLKESHGKGAYETMLYGMIGLHISGERLDAERLQSINALDIESCFRIKYRVESATSVPGLTKEGPGPLYDLAKRIQKVLNDAGRILWEKGQKSFATLLFGDNDFTAAGVVKKLVETFPAFDDHTFVKVDEGEGGHVDVAYYKKAQLNACDLYKALRRKDERFAFADISSLTVFTDNVLPAVLRYEGIIEVEEELVAKIDKKEVIKPGREECELRAAAVVACEHIIASLKEQRDVEIPAMDLDYYLWRLGKKDGYRERERHYTKDTMFY
uniref:Queuosine 5'-phosphate N-glycosylase/hydrolase n=1 Tax=Palpitomonas bilix TaxID=652834 RepID=A0A7S3DF13_9EUKA|mmetsp:Transcript_34196/g.88308  ORF Transcript_34196/g.88308 Transcript_34196/m.88308 type:complete len:347 (+) Transcript_34196:68-1108(+)